MATLKNAIESLVGGLNYTRYDPNQEIVLSNENGHITGRIKLSSLPQGGGGSNINNTDDVPEGNTNKYYTDLRAQVAIVGRLSTEDRIAALNALIDGGGSYIPTSKLVASWSINPSDDKVPSEKLVYQSAVWQK